MAWIRSIPEEEAQGRLAELYARVADPVSGRVDNVLAIHSMHPAGLAAHFELYRAVMRGTRSLPKAEREMIAVVVSQENGCHY